MVNSVTKHSRNSDEYIAGTERYLHLKLTWSSLLPYKKHISIYVYGKRTILRLMSAGC